MSVRNATRHPRGLDASDQLGPARRRGSVRGGDRRERWEPRIHTAARAAWWREKHLRNIRQLTRGGENAEAYFSPDGSRLIYQSTRPDYPCDQIYTMRIDGTDARRVSTGTGRTTCGYFYPGGKEILFASTHEASPACPPRPSYVARLRLADLRRLRHLSRER